MRRDVITLRPRSASRQAADLEQSKAHFPALVKLMVSEPSVPAAMCDISPLYRHALELAQGGVSLASYRNTAWNAFVETREAVRNLGRGVASAQMVSNAIGQRLQGGDPTGIGATPCQVDFLAAEAALPGVALDDVAKASRLLAASWFAFSVCRVLKLAEGGHFFDNGQHCIKAMVQYLKVAVVANQFRDEVARDAAYGSYDDQLALAVSLGLTDVEAEVAVEDYQMSRGM